MDWAVFPAYEHTNAHLPYPYIMPAGIPTADHLITRSHSLESVSQTLYRDGLPTNLAPIDMSENAACEAPAERLISEKFWQPISSLLCSALNPDVKADADSFAVLIANLKKLRQEQETLMATTSTGRDPVDEPTMIDRNMLISSYSALEVLRALPRLTNEIKERVIQNKAPHPLKSQVPKDWAKEIDAEVKGAYEVIGKVANSYIDLLQKRGVLAIKAQVRWGATGEALKHLISDDDVEHYAKEYVDSAVEAWKGVLQVKLR